MAHIYILLAALWLLASCTQEADSLPEYSEFPICWSVNLEQGQDARSLVDNALLQSSCTETTDGSNESISVWGRYTYGGKEYIDFAGTPLTYGKNAWNYSGATRYWRQGGIYDFRAFYPQRVLTKMTDKSATGFKGEIDTEEVQEDILVTAQQVDTNEGNLDDAVPLNMQHVFAAVMFKVKAADGFTPPAGEGITSCWLQNSTSDTDLFSTSGTLTHSGNAIQQIRWEKGASTADPMYMWEHEGLSFDTENTLYASNNGGVGNKYTNNDGWLLVVPQQVEAETLTFCYTMKKTGNQVFSVNIPAVAFEPGQRYTYLLEISGSDATLSLGILPWNEKELSASIGTDEFEKKPVYKLVGNGPVNRQANVKNGGLYVIYNPQSGKYLYSNIKATKVDAGDSYGSNDAVDPNYVWRFEHYYSRYYYVESMGELGHFIYCNQMTTNIVPLTHDLTVRGYFSLRDDSGNLRFLSTASGNMFLAVINGVVCGTNSASSYVSQRNLELYEVVLEE